jgi:hypothetical protein
MRVSIDHGEKTEGLVFKKNYYTVTTKVEFGEEEKQIIKQRKLSGFTVLKRPVPANQDPRKVVGIEDIYDLRISKLVDGVDVYYLATVGEAKAYEADVKAALVQLKAFLQDNAGIDKKSTSFEL